MNEMHRFGRFIACGVVALTGMTLSAGLAGEQARGLTGGNSGEALPSGSAIRTSLAADGERGPTNAHAALFAPAVAESAGASGPIVGWGQQVVVPPEELENLIAIAAGWYHSMGLKQDGQVVAWGWNNNGQTNVPAPNSGFIAIAARGNHSMGLKQDGSIVAWLMDRTCSSSSARGVSVLIPMTAPPI